MSGFARARFGKAEGGHIVSIRIACYALRTAVTEAATAAWSASAPVVLPPEAPTWGDHRPSDRAGPSRVALLSVHTSPLHQPGGGDSGGMNVYLSALSRHLAKTGAEVEVFTRATSDDQGSVAMVDGVTVHHISAGPPQIDKSDLASHLCAFSLGVMRHPAIRGVEVLHGHYWMSGWAGRVLRRRLGLPLVQTFHTLARQKNDHLPAGDVPEPPLRVAAEERVVRDSDAIVASTASEAAFLRDRYGAAPGRVHVVAPGVDLDVFRPDATARPPGTPTILFVGRLQPLKAPDLPIRALAALHEVLPPDAPRPRLLMVGGASGSGIGVTDPAALRALAAQLGVADRVEVHPPVPQHELALLYRAADVVVMPSHSETFGLVALEAQACGTPVVAADVDGLRSVVATGGSLVATREPRDWAHALVPYLLDASYRDAVSAAALAHARTHAWTRTAAGVREVYSHVVGDRAATSAPDAQVGARVGA